MPDRIVRKWRPSLLLVLGGTLAVVLALPLVGLLALREMIGPLGFRQSALLIGSAVLGATAILAVLLWRLILRPVQALAASAEMVRTGGPIPRALDHYGTRELQALGERVLDMALVLNDREAAIRSFTDHVTHELRTPITAIRGAAEVLDAVDTLGPTDRLLVTTIAAAAERMDGQLGALRRIAAAREPSHRGTVKLADLAAALRQAFPMVEFALEGADVTLPLRAAGMEIVLSQMVANAADHGATRVTLAAADGPEGPTLTVADNGRGISEGNRPHVFDPFFTTRRETGGTGMGLSIVRNLIQAHGGRIALAEAGEGAVFRIEF